MRNNTNSSNMESSFYEDSNGQYVPVTTQAQTSAGNSLKRPATLELNASKSRKARFNASVTAPPVITSPDLQVLKLVSPELEKIIINSAALPTPTPSSILYPTKVSTGKHTVPSKCNVIHLPKVIKSRILFDCEVWMLNIQLYGFPSKQCIWAISISSRIWCNLR